MKKPLAMKVIVNCFRNFFAVESSICQSSSSVNLQNTCVSLWKTERTWRRFRLYNFYSLNRLRVCRLILDVRTCDVCRLILDVRTCDVCRLILGVRTCDVCLCCATVVVLFFIVLPSLFDVNGELHRFLHRG